jgi:hypothetical protein
VIKVIVLALTLTGCSTTESDYRGVRFGLNLLETHAELCRAAEEQWIGDGLPVCEELRAFAKMDGESCEIYLVVPLTTGEMRQFYNSFWHEVRHCNEGAWHE